MEPVHTNLVKVIIFFILFRTPKPYSPKDRQTPKSFKLSTPTFKILTSMSKNHWLQKLVLCPSHSSIFCDRKSSLTSTSCVTFQSQPI